MSDSLPRWERLQITLATAGIDAKIDTRIYPGGVSRSVFLRQDDGGAVEIHDKWWRKNDDVWIGWEVSLSDREGICLWSSPLTKKRSEVLAYTQDAIAKWVTR